MNTLTFFFLQLLCLTMRHLHQPNHFFFLTLDTSSSWENHTSLLVHVLIIVFNIHESSLFITRSISSYIIAYQWVHSFAHVIHPSRYSSPYPTRSLYNSSRCARPVSHSSFNGEWDSTRVSNLSQKSSRAAISQLFPNTTTMYVLASKLFNRLQAYKYLSTK